MKPETLDRLLADDRAAPRALITRLADGAQAWVTEHDRGGEMELSADQLAQIRRGFVGDRSGFLSDSTQLFARFYAPPPRLIVVGAVHVAQALAPMAQQAGFTVVMVDPRRAFASVERFPSIDLIHEWPGAALAALALDSRSAVVTLTHDPKFDDEALVAALASQAFYIGALGSRGSHAKRLARLRERGISEGLERIHAPIGLDLGGRSPGEIAVAILAEIIQARHSAK